MPDQPSDIEKEVFFHDPDQPKWAFSASEFYATTIFLMLIRGVWIGSFIVYYLQYETGQSKAPLMAFGGSSLFFFTTNLALAMKKGHRKKSSQDRLLSHRERRHEEIFFGWLPLPWRLAVFELRVAACQVGIDLSECRLIFDESVSEEELRAAIGENTLGHLKAPGMNSDPKRDNSLGEQNTQVRELHVVKHVYRREDGAVECTALAMLLRIALDESFATPAFGEPAEAPYILMHFDALYFMAFLGIGSLPFVSAEWLGNNGGTYGHWGITSCIFSTFTTIAFGGLLPQGFFFGAFVSIRRRRRMLEFLNCLICLEQGSFRSGILNEDSIIQSKWRLPLDLTRAENIDLWRRCREVVMRFGEAHKQRTDSNGGILLFYGIMLTIFLLFATVISNGKLIFEDYAYPILLHLSTLPLLTLFMIKLAREGELFATASEKSKDILSSSILSLESSRHKLGDKQRQDLDSARFATQLLQETLTASRWLHPIDMLGIIDLNKTLVISAIVAFVTQLVLLLQLTNTVEGV